MHTDLSLNKPGAAVRQKIRELEPNRLKRMVARISPRSELHSWVDGLLGERITGRRLDKLRSRGWRVLHAIQWASGSDIDHLVIGPAGVFTVNSKRHKGKRVWYGDHAITVNRAPTRHIAISQHEARRVERVLKRHFPGLISVRPVIAVVDAVEVTVKNSDPPVLVVDVAKLDRLLSGLTPVLPPETVNHIFEVARKPETWAPH